MQKGFTLMELLVYIALIGLIGTAMVRYTIGVSNARNKNFVTQEVQAQGRTALQMISQRIRAANAVNATSSTFGTDPGVLSLAMSDSSKNPTIIDLTADDGRLRIKEGSSATQVISDDNLAITNLVFTDLTSTSLRENVRVQLTVEYNNTSGDVNFDASQTFQTSVSIRQ